MSPTPPDLPDSQEPTVTSSKPDPESTHRTSKVRCLACQDVIESKYTHDFVRCKCKSIFVDGGPDYLRFGWPSGDYRKWVEVLDDPGADVEAKSREG